MSGEPENNRPGNLVSLLLCVGEFMALADVAFAAMFEQQGREYEGGSSVQDDLAALAGWFADHPAVDKAIYKAVFGETVAP